MKKDTLRGMIVALIILVLYHLVAFLVPGLTYNGTFWASYGFTLAGFVVVCAAFYIGYTKQPDAKSRFYGFPIVRIGAIYGIAQLAVSILVMFLAAVIPAWIAILVYAIGMGAAVIGLVSAEAVLETIKTQDVQLKKDVKLMRALQSKVSQMAIQCQEPALKALAEEFRYSDPVSDDAIANAEADLADTIDVLQNAVVDADEEMVKVLCARATALLAERNRLCKLNKD